MSNRIIPVHSKRAARALRSHLNPAWVNPSAFEGWKRIEVDPQEPHSANALWFGGPVIYPRAFPSTRKRLEEAGIAVVPVDLSELAKAEGAVTCCSLLILERPVS